MYFAFVAVAITGVIFFIFYRRQFDFVSAGYMGMLVYFFPGFIGYVANLYYPWLDPSVPIVDGAYILWTSALLATILTGLIYNPSPIPLRPLRTSNQFDFAVIFVIISTLILALWFGGPGVLSPDKHEVLESVDRFFILFSTSTQIGLIAFVIQKKLVKAAVPAAGILFLLYLGFRSDLALATVAIATYFAYKRGIFAYAKPTYLASIAAIGVVILIYKPLLNAYRFGRFAVAENYLNSQDLFVSAILGSEPFVTQAILNEVISQDFSLGVGSLFYSLAGMVPFLTNILGIDAENITFNFQDQIFPHLTYGAGSNIYAHFYATIGSVGVVLFMVLHNSLLVAASKLIRSRNEYIAVVALSVGSFFAFYVHRNDLLNSILSVNRSILTIAIIFVIVSFLGGRFSPRATEEARGSS